MMPTVFAEVLAARRADYNGRMHAARQRYPRLAQDVFLGFLHSHVGPLAETVDALAPLRVAGVVDACYDAALELVGRALVGPAAAGSALRDSWRDVMPRFAGLLAGHPAEVVGLLSNAALYLAAIPGTRCGQWNQEMIAASASIGTLAQLRAAGQINAWRAGAAHFRAGALAACTTLPEALALALLHAPPGVPLDEVMRQMAADPWWHGLDVHGCREREIGAFSGFGGQFGAPPEVRAADDGFLVRARDRAFFLVADAYGAVLRPSSIEEFGLAPPNNGDVCVNATTVAVTAPTTHAIRLVAA